MTEAIRQLALSPRGRRVLSGVLHLMEQHALGLDKHGRAALVALLHQYWQSPVESRNSIIQVLDDADTRQLPIVMGINQTDGRYVLHVPADLGDIPVEFLELDDPDYPGYEARGLTHPSRQSDHLRHDSKYNTHEESI